MRRCQSDGPTVDQQTVTLVTFAALCTAMDVAGVEVRVALDDDMHRIRLIDHHHCRSLDVPVKLGFDREVTALCCSLALCLDMPLPAGRGLRLARAWPELVALARAAVDLRMSEGACEERPL